MTQLSKYLAWGASAARLAAFLTAPTLVRADDRANDTDTDTNDDRASVTCADGLYIIAVRGTAETGIGSLANLTEPLTKAIPDSIVKAVDYPATFLDYDDSVEDGVDEVRDLVEDYVRACPSSSQRPRKIALLGFSQGAQVLSEYICGGQGGTFDDDPSLAKTNYLSADIITSAVLVGDPAHNTKATFNHGTSTNNGLFARPDNSLAYCNSQSDRVRVYCDTGDVYCDRGKDSAVHGSYFDTYGREIVDFVEARFRNEDADDDASSTSAGASSSSSSGSSEATNDVSGSGRDSGNDGDGNGDDGNAASQLSATTFLGFSLLAYLLV